jgi:hypothetical protein
MGDGDGAAPLIGAWLAGWTQMAAGMAASAEAFAAQTGENDVADGLWIAMEAQFTLCRAQATAMAGQARSAVGRETLERFLDPGQWLFGGAGAPDPALQKLINGPEPTSLGAFGREALRASPEWADLRRARGAHRATVAGAWRRCFARLAADTEALSGVEAMLDRWAAIAGEELDALHADPAFLEGLRRLVMAAVALREAEARLVEAFCEAHGLPTRREVDDLHRTVTDLRRELRRLRGASASGGEG